MISEINDASVKYVMHQQLPRIVGARASTSGQRASRRHLPPSVGARRPPKISMKSVKRCESAQSLLLPVILGGDLVLSGISRLRMIKRALFHRNFRSVSRSIMPMFRLDTDPDHLAVACPSRYTIRGFNDGDGYAVCNCSTSADGFHADGRDGSGIRLVSSTWKISICARNDTQPGWALRRARIQVSSYDGHEGRLSH